MRTLAWAFVRTLLFRSVLIMSRYKIVWRWICLDLLPFHREAYTTLFGKCQRLARNKVYVLLVFFPLVLFVFDCSARATNGSACEWVSESNWVSVEWYVTVVAAAALLLLLLLAVVVFFVQRLLSIGKLFYFASCVQCKHTFWAKWMCIVCRCTHRLNISLELKIPGGKAFGTMSASMVEKSLNTIRLESCSRFPLRSLRLQNITRALTHTHTNTSYSRNGTLLPLGSIHMALYNSYNGLLIVALKLFKKQYRRKWFYGSFCVSSLVPYRSPLSHPIFIIFVRALFCGVPVVYCTKIALQ